MRGRKLLHRIGPEMGNVLLNEHNVQHYRLDIRDIGRVGRHIRYYWRHESFDVSRRSSKGYLRKKLHNVRCYWIGSRSLIKGRSRFGQIDIRNVG